ncbi:MAG: putative Ig domain-containing protein [Chloroflexota bacterium]|nr:putative Ig domain-containing protein [Chloroflexota bacterium]
MTVFFLGWSTADAEQYSVPLFPAPGAPGDPQGILRIVNDAGEAVTVRVFAIDENGMRFGPAIIALGAASAAEFDATELQSANAAKGLSGGLGSFSGDVRLTIDSDAPIVPLAFVRASDGTLSAMHDTVRAGPADEGEYRYEVPMFNLSTAVAQDSRLRLINAGDTPAAVTIEGRDDGAVATGETVRLTLPAGGARTLTAQQLEAGGAGLTGQLGAGIGRWRLTVSSDQPLLVVNVAASPAGYWSNLSTTAVRGAAPADLAGFNDRFVGESAVLETGAGRSSLMPMENGRFSETQRAGGMAATYEGGYNYVGLGPDAGRLTLDYDDGTRCRVNIYFSSLTSGWFASRCTGGPDLEDTWSGGNWFVGAIEDDGGGADPVATTYGVDDSLPGVPASGLFVPARLSGGSTRVSGGSTTIDLNDGGYIDLDDGTRYTCTSEGGCGIVDGTVTRGSVTGRTSGSGGGEIDRFPILPREGRPGNRTYTVGTEIDALTLPEATGGNPPLTYSLSPAVPGLIFDAAARRLTGTPTEAGSYAMSYTVTDADGDQYTFYFTIAVEGGTATGTAAGFEVPVNSRGIAYANDRFYVMHWGRDKIYAYTGAGQPDPDNDFDLVDDIGPLHRLSYANGRFYVFHVQGDDGKLFAYTVTGQRDASNDFVLNDDNVWPRGIVSADGRNYVVNIRGRKVYAYTASGAREPAADFDLDDDNDSPSGIVHASGRFYVVDSQAAKVFAYTGSGARDSGADFELACDNGDAIGIAYASGSFHVLDFMDGRVYRYSGADGNPDLSVCFPEKSAPGTQIFRVGTAISDVILPAARPTASGGALTYSLSPAVPGLSFDAATRRLSGTPTEAGRFNMTYTVTDAGGESDSLTFVIAAISRPDLAVESVSVSDSGPDEGASFTLRATVRNLGNDSSPATTLRYYRSTNATITRSDTEVGMDAVEALDASGASAESVSLTAPSSAGTYYYGACVDSVEDEWTTHNNCSSAVRVTVGGSDGGGDGDPAGACKAELIVNPGESCTYKEADFRVNSSGRGSIQAGGILLSSDSEIDARGSTFNGVRWNFHATRNSRSNSWTIQVAD